MAGLSESEVAYYRQFPEAMAANGITEDMLGDGSSDDYSSFGDPLLSFPLNQAQLDANIQERQNRQTTKETGDLTYQGIYPKKPEVSTLDTVKATTSDFLNWASSFEGGLNLSLIHI